jgi:small subunit ribosomal protein S16
MATKIRLQRHGRKNYAYYHVVIADSRAPRDGKFVERIGSYNPNTNPATIDLNFEKALNWVLTGAQPTDTVRSILSAEGVYMMKHLLGGVKKGAFDQAEAEKRFEAWKTAKTSTVETVKGKLSAEAEAKNKKRLQDEADKNKAKAAEIASKKAEALEALVAASAPAVVEEAPATEETPAAE